MPFQLMRGLQFIPPIRGLANAVFRRQDDLMTEDVIPSETPHRGNVTMSLGEAIKMGQTMQRNGFLRDAETVYRQILAAKPNQPDALHFLGVVLTQTGRRDEGIASMMAALEVMPNYVDAISNLGNVLHEQGHFAHAEAAYRRAIELTPNFADAYLNLAALLFETARFEDAVAYSQRAMELGPTIPQDRLDAGNALAKEGRHADAAEEYLSAMERNLFHAGVHDNMGQSLQRLGRLDEAEKIYRRWINLDPTNPRPRHYLAACTGIGIPPRASDEYIVEVFDRFAATFDERLAALEYSAPAVVIESVKSELGEPDSRFRVLDAGCGTGLCAAGIRPFARHLTGVDLSPKMLVKASELKLYDELVACELTEYLLRSPQSFDLIISADTLVYFGDLVGVTAAAATALRPEGRFIFTIEQADPKDAVGGFRLESHGRYAHTGSYVRTVLEQSGLDVAKITETFLRMEGNTPVNGWLVIGRAAVSQTS